MKRRRGIVLIILLITTVLVMMMAGSLLGLARMDLGSAGQYQSRQRALEMARGGLNHAIRLLTLNPGHNTDIGLTDGDSSYNVTFASGATERSVNNLASDTQSPVNNYLGGPVWARTADLLVVGRAGRSRVRVRGVLSRGINFNRSIGAVGKVTLEGNSLLDGIKSLLDPTPAGGGIMSQDSGADAITWTGGTFEMKGDTRLGTPAENGVAANLKALYPDRIQRSGSETVPNLDIGAMVNSMASKPQPTYKSVVGSTRYLGPTSFNSDHYVPGDLVINGDLVLGDASLFVKGKLTVNGGIIGTGSVMADGDLAIRGGNSVLLSNQSSGAAVYSSGKVTMEGLDASGYLDQLAASHPNIGTQKTRVKNQLDLMDNAAQAPINPANQDVLWGATRELNRNDGATMGTRDDYYLCPIPGPNGDRALGGSAAPVPSLTLAIKNDLGPAYATDVKAQKVVHALDQTFYNFRFSFYGTNATETLDANYRLPGVTPQDFYNNKFVGRWDDDPLMLVFPANAWDAWTSAVRAANPGVFKNLTADHQYRAVGTTAGTNDDLRQTMFDQVASFIHYNHPLGLNWLGKSYFQGVVYAGNGLEVSNQFEVVGGLLSRSDIKLTGGSSLVYNEEMMRFTGTLGPVQLQVYEEY